MLASKRELEARSAVAQEKILPRNKKYSVIRSKEESDRLGTGFAVYPFGRFRRILKTHRIFFMEWAGDFFL